MGWKCQAGSFGEGTLFSAALLKFGSLRFLLSPVTCGSRRAQAEADGTARASVRKWRLRSSASVAGIQQSTEIVQTGHCANTPLCVTSIVQTGVYWRPPGLGCLLTKSA